MYNSTVIFSNDIFGDSEKHQNKKQMDSDIQQFFRFYQQAFEGFCPKQHMTEVPSTPALLRTLREPSASHPEGYYSSKTHSDCPNRETGACRRVLMA